MQPEIFRDHGMDWEEILEYKTIILKIVCKYVGDFHLREDVVSEVMLALYEDKRLDVSKFKKKDAAIRNTIRNKTLKVLRCKKRGRTPKFLESLEVLANQGMEVDTFGNWYVADPFEKNFFKLYDPGEE